MDFAQKTNDEILRIADPILDDTIRAGNERNWDLFSKYMPKEYITEEHRKNIEAQWSNNILLTSLTLRREFIDILRRKDCVVVLWKVWSTELEGEFVAVLSLEDQDGVVKAIGTMIH